MANARLGVRHFILLENHKTSHMTEKDVRYPRKFLVNITWVHETRAQDSSEVDLQQHISI